MSYTNYVLKIITLMLVLLFNQEQIGMLIKYKSTSLEQYNRLTKKLMRKETDTSKNYLSVLAQTIGNR